MRTTLSLRSVTALLLTLSLFFCGCSPSSDSDRAGVAKTPTAERSARRAYDGAPPVIPHEDRKAKCVTCHSQTGEKVAQMGFAPANPHRDTSVAGATQNCRQCHLFRNSQDLFAETGFVGIPQTITGGTRAYPGAPPMIPHSELMRENCLACHSGPAARREIVCDHTERANCRQCHLFQQRDTVAAFQGL